MVCVSRLGFDKAVEEAKSRMARYNVTPNMLIVPPQEKIRIIEPGSRTLEHTVRVHASVSFNPRSSCCTWRSRPRRRSASELHESNPARTQR